MKPPLPLSPVLLFAGGVWVVGVVVVGAVVAGAVVAGAVVWVCVCVCVVGATAVVVVVAVEVDGLGFGFGTLSLGSVPFAGAAAFTVAPATWIVSAAAGCLPAATGSAPPPEEPLRSSAATKPTTAMARTMRS